MKNATLITFPCKSEIISSTWPSAIISHLPGPLTISSLEVRCIVTVSSENSPLNPRKGKVMLMFNLHGSSTDPNNNLAPHLWNGIIKRFSELGTTYRVAPNLNANFPPGFTGCAEALSIFPHPRRSSISGFAASATTVLINSWRVALRTIVPSRHGTSYAMLPPLGLP